MLAANSCFLGPKSTLCLPITQESGSESSQETKQAPTESTGSLGNYFSLQGTWRYSNSIAYSMSLGFFVKQIHSLWSKTCQKKTIFHSHQIICIFPSFKGIKCLLYAHLCVVQKREEGISTSSTILSYAPLRHRLSLKLELSIFWVEGQLATPELVLAPFPSVLALCVITGPGSTFLRRCWDLNSHSHAFILSHLSSPYRVLLMSGRTTLRRRSRGQRLFILFTEIS